MSYINSALKKVQQERDGRSVPHEGAIQASHPDVSPGKRKGAPLYFGGAIVVVGIVAGLAWFFLPEMIKPKVVPSALLQIPETSPVAELPHVTVNHGPATLRLYEDALAAQRSQRWDEAETLYKKVIAFDPRNVESLNNLGVIYMGRKRLAEALELFVKAIAAKEDYVDPYYNLACLYAQMHNTKASLSYLQRAVKIDGSARDWAKADLDFKGLRSLPAFKQITEELVE